MFLGEGNVARQHAQAMNIAIFATTGTRITNKKKNKSEEALAMAEIHQEETEVYNNYEYSKCVKW